MGEWARRAEDENKLLCHDITQLHKRLGLVQQESFDRDISKRARRAEDDKTLLHQRILEANQRVSEAKHDKTLLCGRVSEVEHNNIQLCRQVSWFNSYNTPLRWRVSDLEIDVDHVSTWGRHVKHNLHQTSAKLSVLQETAARVPALEETAARVPALQETPPSRR